MTITSTPPFGPIKEAPTHPVSPTMIAPKKAAEKLASSKFLTIMDTRPSIAALMTKMKMPSVKTVKGRVRRRTRGLMMALTIPSKSPAARKDPVP